MTREALIKKVALKMDEISSSDDVIVAVGIDDNNPLYAQINGLLNEAVNDVLSKAPTHRLASFIIAVPKDDIRVDNAPDGQRQVAVVKVPSGFIRIVSVTDELFKRPIVELALEGDEVDKKQHNRFLMAKNTKPVAVLSHGTSGKIITCYSYGMNDEPKLSVRYIKRFEGDLDASSDIDMDDYLADVVTWACAGKAFAARGDADKAKICDDNAIALMV